MECRVAYDKMMEDGSQKKVPEIYVVEANSFTEAEERAIEELAHYATGEFEVKDIKLASYGEVVFADNDDESTDQRYWKAKVKFIIIDEKTGKEKYSTVNYLVQAPTLRGALDGIDSIMNGSMQDYVQANIGETSIIDVLEYKKKEVSHE